MIDTSSKWRIFQSQQLYLRRYSSQSTSNTATIDNPRYVLQKKGALAKSLAEEANADFLAIECSIDEKPLRAGCNKGLKKALSLMVYEKPMSRRS